MSVYEPIDMKVAGQVTPYFQYKRIDVAHYREYAFFPVDAAYGYLLRSATVKFNRTWRFSRIDNFSPELLVEFFSGASVKGRQNEAFAVTDITTPAGNDDHDISANPSPVAPGNINTMTVGKRGARKLLNFYYPLNDIIEVHFTGFEVVGGEFWPTMIDLVLEGYLVPEPGLSQWKGGN